MIERNFEVLSLTAIGTLDQDIDVGVVRVSRDVLRDLGGRNSLVRVHNPGKGKSIIRIVRAKTGKKALTNDQIALQYDDRHLLGIYNEGSNASLQLTEMNQWLALPGFLLGHSSPLVRKEAVFALAMAIVGAILGTFLGLAISGLLA